MTLLTAARPFAFKLELPDGRWTVEEKWLEEAPAVGTIVELRGRWQVRAVESLPSSVGRERPLVICRPA